MQDPVKTCGDELCQGLKDLGITDETIYIRLFRVINKMKDAVVKQTVIQVCINALIECELEGAASYEETDYTNAEIRLVISKMNKTITLTDEDCDDFRRIVKEMILARGGKIL